MLLQQQHQEQQSLCNLMGEWMDDNKCACSSSNCPEAPKNVAAPQLQLSQRRRRWQNPPLFEAAGLFMHGSQWLRTAAPLIDGSDQTDWLTDTLAAMERQCVSVDKVNVKCRRASEWEWLLMDIPAAALLIAVCYTFQWSRRKLK